MQIAVQPVEPSHPALLNLLQLYLYDLSELASIELGADGRFDEAELRAELGDPGALSFLISFGAHLIGFAIVGARSRAHADFSGRTVSHFFIVRRYRRNGYGRAAAYRLFEEIPGPWEVATYGANIPAISFWRSVIDGYTGGRYDETWLHTREWRGSIQLFIAQREAPTPAAGSSE